MQRKLFTTEASAQWNISTKIYPYSESSLHIEIYPYKSLYIVKDLYKKLSTQWKSLWYLMTTLIDYMIKWANNNHKTNKDVEKVKNLKAEGASYTSRYHLAQSLLLISMLYFHSMFEDIVIDIVESEGDTCRALWMVCLHNIFVVITMWIALLRMMSWHPLLYCMTYIFLFWLLSPIRVAINIVIDDTTKGLFADWIYTISVFKIILLQHSILFHAFSLRTPSFCIILVFKWLKPMNPHHNSKQISNSLKAKIV